MKTITEGHHYTMDSLDGVAKNEIVFVKRFRGQENHPGTTNQEVLRVLLDRVKFLDKEKPWEGNKKILHHLRMALVLHESRALERKVEKDEVAPEFIEKCPKDGHFTLRYKS